MIELFVLLLGLLFGSFASMLTYRLPRGEDIVKGRSRCPKCRQKISWYDNLPVLSYVLLGGKCRNCSKRISLRYPIIEISTSVVFLLVYLFYKKSCLSGSLCVFKSLFGFYALPLLLLFSFILVLIFFIDLEHMLVLDSLVFTFFVLELFFFLIKDSFNLYPQIFSAFFFSSIFLILNLATKGRGMGLGDVKLSIPIGLFLGLKAGVYWFFLSFLTGALIGTILILLKKAKFGKHIPFAPFIVVGFFLTLFFEGYIDTFFLLR